MQNKKLLTTVCGIALLLSMTSVTPAWAAIQITKNEDGTETIIDGDVTIVRNANGATLSRTETTTNPVGFGPNMEVLYETTSTVKDYQTGKMTSIVNSHDGSKTETITENNGKTTTTTTTPGKPTVIETKENGIITTETTSNGKKTVTVDNQNTKTKTTTITEGNITKVSVENADGSSQTTTTTNIINGDGTTRKAVVTETVTADKQKTIVRENGDFYSSETTDKNGNVIAYDKRNTDYNTGVTTISKKELNGNSYEKTENLDGSFSEKKTEGGVTTETSAKKNDKGQLEETTTVTTEDGGGLFARNDVTQTKKIKDEKGNVISMTETTNNQGGLLTSDSVVTKTTNYDSNGKEIGVTEVNSDTGITKTTVYDNASGGSTTTETDEKGQLLKTTTTEKTEDGGTKTAVKDEKTGKTVTTTRDSFGMEQSVETAYTDKNKKPVIETKYSDGKTSKTHVETVGGQDVYVTTEKDAANNQTTITKNGDTTTITQKNTDGSSYFKETTPGGEIERSISSTKEVTATRTTFQLDENGQKVGYTKETKVDGKLVAEERSSIDPTTKEKVTVGFDQRTGVSTKSIERIDGSSETSTTTTDPNNPEKILTKKTIKNDGKGSIERAFTNEQTGEYSNTTTRNGDVIKEESKTKNPDGSFTTKEIGLGKTDAEGNQIASNIVTEIKDANGNVIASKRETETRTAEGSRFEEENMATDEKGNKVTTSRAAVINGKDKNGEDIVVSTTEKTKTEKSDGTVTETSKSKNHQTGATQETNTMTLPDGTVNEIVKEKDSNGYQTTTVSTTRPDKSSSVIKTMTTPEGTIIKTDTQTAADGSKVETYSVLDPNSGVQTITETKCDASGKCTQTVQKDISHDGTAKIKYSDGREIDLSASGLATRDTNHKLFDGTQYQGYTWHGLVDNEYGTGFNGTSAGKAMDDRTPGALGGKTLKKNPTVADF